MAVDISDLPPPKASVSVSGAPVDISDLPAPKEKPGFGAKAGAFGYGLVTGIAGSVGDIESMLPGGSEVGVKGKGALKGYETVFPTTKNIEAGLTKLGVPQPSAAVKGYETAGELAPAVVAGGKAVYELGKYGAKKIGGLISGGKDLANELKATTSARLGEETTKAGERAERAEKRAGVAGQIAERESGKQQGAYGQLPGVTTETIAGEKKSVPEVMGSIGQRIKDTTAKVRENLKTTRSTNAENNKAAAFGFAKQKEINGARVKDTKAFDEMLTEVKGLIKDPETKLANATLGDIKGPLEEIKRALKPQYLDPSTGVVHGTDASFASLEDLRRLLRDRAYGIPGGFDAINKVRAGKLADKVEAVLSEFSEGKIDKFIKQYAADSKPLQVFESKLGKAFVGQQEGTEIASVAAQDIPGNAFKSRENFQSLVDAMGGDVKTAQAEASRYFANKMEAMTTGKQAQAFLRDNREMLKNTGAYDMADKYARQIIAAEKRGAGATAKGESRLKTAEEQNKFKNDLNILQSDLGRATSVTEIDNAVKNVANRLEKAGVFDVAERAKFLDEAKSILDKQKKIDFVNKIVKWGLSGGSAYGAYSLYSAKGGS